jgi:hypothetical protein
MWLEPSREFRAYRQLPGARQCTTLAADTADSLAEAIRNTSQAAERHRARAGQAVTAARPPSEGSG